MNFCSFNLQVIGKVIPLQILLFFLFARAIAQDKVTISGTVTDGQTVMPNVSIQIKGTNQGNGKDYERTEGKSCRWIVACRRQTSG